MSDFNELANRCEKASGPDRELDILIGYAVDLRGDDGHLNLRESFDICGMEQMLRMAESYQNIWRQELPRYTASIDAIRTLGGMVVFASDIAADGLAMVKIVADTAPSRIIEHTGIASRLEHAWLAAALRARAPRRS